MRGKTTRVYACVHAVPMQRAGQRHTLATTCARALAASGHGPRANPCVVLPCPYTRLWRTQRWRPVQSPRHKSGRETKQPSAKKRRLRRRL